MIGTVLTDRLEVRLPVDGDRRCFVELFGDAAFMEFSGGVLDEAAANRRFDRMLANAAEMPYAKQPIVERASGAIVGYTGVDRFEFEGTDEIEFGWRLVPAARGEGYATEAAAAVMTMIETSFVGTVLVMIDPTNVASQRVAAKLGFEFWKLAEVHGFVDEIHRCTFGGSDLPDRHSP